MAFAAYHSWEREKPRTFRALVTFREGSCRGPEQPLQDRSSRVPCIALRSEKIGYSRHCHRLGRPTWCPWLRCSPCSGPVPEPSVVLPSAGCSAGRSAHHPAHRSRGGRRAGPSLRSRRSRCGRPDPGRAGCRGRRVPGRGRMPADAIPATTAGLPTDRPGRGRDGRHPLPAPRERRLLTGHGS